MAIMCRPDRTPRLLRRSSAGSPGLTERNFNFQFRISIFDWKPGFALRPRGLRDSPIHNSSEEGDGGSIRFVEPSVERDSKIEN